MNSLYYNYQNISNSFKVELNEKFFFFFCKKCHNIPHLFLKDYDIIIIECNYCNIKSQEKIKNISNYSSEWISNRINIKCDKEHKENIFATVFCKSCNLYLCNECSKNHKNIHNEFNILSDYRVEFCDYHNKKTSYYCHNCDIEFCEECIKSHKNHKYIDINNNLINEIKGGLINLKFFEKFLLKTINIQKEKYKFVNEITTNLDKPDEDNKELLNKTISQIIKLFYQEFKIEQNLIILSKIIFFTFKISRKSYEINEKFKTILKVIYDKFDEEEIKKFKNSIISLKNKYKIISDKLSGEEQRELQTNIENTFKIYNQKDSNFIKEKGFIENSIISSGIIKKYITIDKEKNPNDYIDINEKLYNNESIYKNLNSLDDNNFVLSLLGKYIEKDGIETIVSKKKNEKFKDIELASFQSMVSFNNQKKYELHFNFGNDTNNKILNEPLEKEKFLKEWKTKLAKKLSIIEDRLILTDVHRGSVAVHVVIIDSTKNEEIKILQESKKIKEITKIDKKPLIDSLIISSEILDKRGNKSEGWSINQKRGGENYIPPIKGWFGIGLKVLDKYDNGKNDWIGNQNKKGEYAVGYIGINNLYNDKEQIIDNINTLAQNTDAIKNKLYINEENLRKSSVEKIFGGLGIGISVPLFIFINPLATKILHSSLDLYFRNLKCGDGVCVFQNPDYAENGAGFIDIPGYRIKIILMCRVNPKKIRQPKNFPECWILSPNDIRPYRILIKKIPKSPLTDLNNNHLTISYSPVDYIINAIKSKDFSFINLSKEEKFKYYSVENHQQLKDDIFVIKLYSDSFYIYINEYLRAEKINYFTKEQLNSWTCCLQLALSRNKNVKENTVVYRGVKYKFPSDIGIGSKFYFREFVSTSIKKEFCEDWINNKGTIMIITIKNNGINGHPNYCYYIEDISMNPKEFEVLISSHCYFTVNKIVKENNIEYVSLTCEGYLIQ